MPISHSDDWAYIHKLFAREVPEIASGVVEIRAVARAPGRRTKIGVTSLDPVLDPIAACVGFKGSRVKAVVAELGGERIDIFPWSDHPERLIRCALAPARVAMVRLDVAGQRAEAVVPSDQLDIAIGTDGVNRDLASQLTGWTIDVIATDAA